MESRALPNNYLLLDVHVELSLDSISSTSYHIVHSRRIHIHFCTSNHVRYVNQTLETNTFSHRFPYFSNCESKKISFNEWSRQLFWVLWLWLWAIWQFRIIPFVWISSPEGASFANDRIVKRMKLYEAFRFQFFFPFQLHRNLSTKTIFIPIESHSIDLPLWIMSSQLLVSRCKSNWHHWCCRHTCKSLLFRIDIQRQWTRSAVKIFNSSVCARVVRVVRRSRTHSIRRWHINFVFGHQFTHIFTPKKIAKKNHWNDRLWRQVNANQLTIFQSILFVRLRFLFHRQHKKRIADDCLSRNYYYYCFDSVILLLRFRLLRNCRTFAFHTFVFVCHRNFSLRIFFSFFFSFVCGVHCISFFVAKMSTPIGLVHAKDTMCEREGRESVSSVD